MRGTREKAILVGVRLQGEAADEVEFSMEELSHLALSAGADVLYPVIQHRARPHPSCYIGRGKAREIGELCRASSADLLIFNAELSAAQVRNLEAMAGVKVVDRTELILDVFSQRARSWEGRLQVELAQLAYVLPRRVERRVWMSRWGAGIGARGPRKTPLTADLRRIRTRIHRIEKKIQKVKSTRLLHRRSRQARAIPVVCLVGYTHSGKSTLFHRLTQVRGPAEDKPFATLDPTVRRMVLPYRSDVLLVDTVGYIRALPHRPVSAFKATLEEIAHADLVLHVIDLSHPAMPAQLDEVNDVLNGLGVSDGRRIDVFNKVDRIGTNGICISSFGIPPDPIHPQEPPLLISARRGEGLDPLLSRIENRLFPAARQVSLRLPMGRGDLLAKVYAGGKVLSLVPTGDGWVVTAEMFPDLLESVRPFLMGEQGFA